MFEHYLPNKNERATVTPNSNFLELNTADRLCSEFPYNQIWFDLFLMNFGEPVLEACILVMCFWNISFQMHNNTKAAPF